DNTINEIIGNQATLTHQNLYAYCFATPSNVIVDRYQTQFPNDNIHGETYDNIVNIVNPNDLIPYVPPIEVNFQRFGNDKYICTQWIEPESYNKYKTEVYSTLETEYGMKPKVDEWEYYNSLTAKEPDSVFKNYTMQQATSDFASYLGTHVGSVDNYVNEYQDEITQRIVESFDTGGTNWKKVFSTMAIKLYTFFRSKWKDADDYVIYDVLIATIAKNALTLGITHGIWLYIEWCKTYDIKYHNPDYELNNYLDTYTYYKIEMTSYNNLKICPKGETEPIAILEQTNTGQPTTTSNSNDIAIGGYWQDTLIEQLVYGEAFLQDISNYDIYYKGEAKLIRSNAHINLYKITPTSYEMVASGSGLDPWWDWTQLTIPE
ncbi:MAG: hypothetical protein HUJ52_04345, partial [Malacoplasma sp.]|nr:hypothetical protein [Malacoplasma sp.]